MKWRTDFGKWEENFQKKEKQVKGEDGEVKEKMNFYLMRERIKVEERGGSRKPRHILYRNKFYMMNVIIRYDKYLLIKLKKKEKRTLKKFEKI